MRKLNQANLHLIRPLYLLIIGLFSTFSLFAVAPLIPQDFSPIDTALAEKYIKKATKVSSDSLTYYYEKALTIYQKAKTESPDTITWKRYFEVSNLWCKTLKNRQLGIRKFPQFRQEAIHKFGVTSQAVANNYYHFAKYLANTKRYEEAKINYEEALSIYTIIQDSLGLIQGYFQNGVLHNYLAEYDKALTFFQSALNYSLAFHGKIHNTTTTCYLKKAQVLYNKGKYQNGLKVMDTLLAIETKIYGLNSPKLTAPYILVGNIYFKETAYDDAILYYEKAKAIYAQDSSNIRGLASCIGNIGAATIEKGDFDKANQLYLQAAELKKAKYGENSKTLAYTYYNIGAGYAEQGDFQAALDYFFKSVRIIRKGQGEDHPDVAYVYTGIGSIYDQTGEWDKAMDYYQKALLIRQKTNTTNHPEIAIDYDKIGALYQKKGDLAAAKTTYDKALTIRKKTLNPTHRAIGDSYFNLATIHRQKKEFVQAATLLQQSLTIKQKQLYEYHPSIANTYLELAKVAEKQADLATALNYFQTAIVHLVPNFKSLNIADNPEIAANFPYKGTLINLLYQKGGALKQAYLQDLEQPILLEQAYTTLKIGSQFADLMRQERLFHKHYVRLKKAHFFKLKKNLSGQSVHNSTLA